MGIYIANLLKQPLTGYSMQFLNRIYKHSPHVIPLMVTIDVMHPSAGYCPVLSHDSNNNQQMVTGEYKEENLQT